MPIDEENLRNWFTYHDTNDPGTIFKYKAIRDAGHALAVVILNNTPASADQSDAIRKVREAVFVANAAIACEGK